MNTKPVHVPVLLQESIEGLKLKKGDIFLDATINGGGHSSEVARRFGKDVKIIGLDLDEDALLEAKARLEEYHADFELVLSNFRNLDAVLRERNIEAVSGILFDLGLSSRQFELSGRGFTFQKNEPLLMTFKKIGDKNDLSAYRIVNEWEEENIADIIFGYGEERYARRIAGEIVRHRVKKPIETTFELLEAIERAVPERYKRGKIHYATRTFQALRIAANDEIGSLREGLRKGFESLGSGGKMAVISFHSIEDRIVKRFFKDKEKEGLAEIHTKKPLIPSIDEVKNNRRSRSAKLRIAERK